MGDAWISPPRYQMEPLLSYVIGFWEACRGQVLLIRLAALMAMLQKVCHESFDSSGM